DEVEGERDQRNGVLAMVLRARARQQQEAFVLVELAPLRSGDFALALQGQDQQLDDASCLVVLARVPDSGELVIFQDAFTSLCRRWPLERQQRIAFDSVVGPQRPHKERGQVREGVALRDGASLPDLREEVRYFLPARPRLEKIEAVAVQRLEVIVEVVARF